MQVGILKVKACESESDCDLTLETGTWIMVAASLDASELRLDVFADDQEVHRSRKLGDAVFRANVQSSQFLQEPKSSFIGGGPQDSNRSKLSGSLGSVSLHGTALAISTLTKQHLSGVTESEATLPNDGSSAAQFFAALSTTPDLQLGSPSTSEDVTKTSAPAPTKAPESVSEMITEEGTKYPVHSSVTITPGHVLDMILFDDTYGPLVEDWSYEANLDIDRKSVV